MAMDSLVEVLAQPGVAVENIALTLNNPPLDLTQGCSSNPVSSWGLPMLEVSLPPGYLLCLWKTTAGESSLSDLISEVDGAKPGVYLLQALPKQLSSSMLPARRLFCRPRPFCFVPQEP